MRALTLGALVLTIAAALVSVLDAGSSSRTSPSILEVTDPAPPVAGKLPTRIRRHGSRHASKSHFSPQKGVGQPDDREPQVSANAHELNAAELTPEATAKPAIELAPKVTPAPPTSATAEFGL
jgi:hypothetical protein